MSRTNETLRNEISTISTGAKGTAKPGQESPRGALARTKEELKRISYDRDELQWLKHDLLAKQQSLLQRIDQQEVRSANAKPGS
jgi:hypothetical protein